MFARTVSVVLLLALAPASRAAAQSAGKFAIGGAMSVRTPDDRDALQSRKGFSLLWRFGHGHAGWGWHWGLNWYSAELDVPVGDQPTELGELHVRPVMAGYGYTHEVGKAKITATVMGGLALATLALSDEAENAYGTRLGARSLSTRATLTPTYRPEVSVWYDLTKKIGINVSTGYAIARPTMTIRSSLGSDQRRIRADMFTFKIGAVYSIF